MTRPNSNRIRIDDLCEPQLNKAQRSALAYGETLKTELTATAVMEAAVKQTGLDNFGPHDFIPRLEAQLQSTAADPWLNGLGRATIFSEKVRNAANRLRVMEVLGKHPEITSLELTRPIIIVGLPRSGTTHLVNMIAADQRFRSLPYWESREPVPRASETASRDSDDPRYQRCAKDWQAQDSMLPLLKNMHAMNPDHIHEEIELMDMDFSSYTLEWIANVPGWRDHYLACDHFPLYRFLADMLRLLSWYQGPNQWILKSPQHLEQLLPLYAAFTDATIVVTHRDPIEVITSAVTMTAYGSRLRNNKINTAGIAAYWIDRIERLLRACVRDLDRLPPTTPKMDVIFQEFMADDMAMVRRIYNLAGIEITATAEQQLATYLAANPRGRYGQIVYDLKGDFGVDPEALRERFSFYYQRYPQLLQKTAS